MKIKKLLLVTFSLIFSSCTRKMLPEVSISNSENLVAGQETDVQNELIEHDDEIIMEEYYDLLQSETELSDKFNVPLVSISIREIEPFVGEGTTLEILQNLKKENLYRIYIYSSLNGYHKSAVLKTPIKKVDYDTIHKGIQRTGNFIV